MNREKKKKRELWEYSNEEEREREKPLATWEAPVDHYMGLTEREGHATPCRSHLLIHVLRSNGGTNTRERHQGTTTPRREKRVFLSGSPWGEGRKDRVIPDPKKK